MARLRLLLWGEHLYFASDYFHQLLCRLGRTPDQGFYKAYVDDTSPPTRSGSTRGTLTEPEQEQPLARPFDR